MKVDSPDIDKGALRQLLQERYGLRIAALRFVPQGEESYGYLVETVDQARYFVKLHHFVPELEVRYQAANALHTQCGLQFVVHPHMMRDGTCLARMGEYDVAVFDYVDGAVPPA